MRRTLGFLAAFYGAAVLMALLAAMPAHAQAIGPGSAVAGGAGGSPGDLQYAGAAGALAGAANIGVAGPAGQMGISITGNDVNAQNAPGDNYALGINITSDVAGVTPNFSDVNGLQVFETLLNGEALAGGATSAKISAEPIDISLTKIGSGQGIGFGDLVQCQGRGDCLAESLNTVNCSGDSISGDESSCGITGVIELFQQGFLVKTTVTSAPVTSACVTTSTGAVTASATAQTFPVGSTSGCNVGDWIVFNAEPETLTPNHSAAQIVAIGSGSITAIVRQNLTPAMTVTGATWFNVASTAWFGQDRMLVDESQGSYSTGTLTGANTGPSINEFSFSGTAFGNTMVGGNAIHPGAIDLHADDIGTTTGSPFSNAAPLLAWRPIDAVIDATHLQIYGASVGGYDGVNTFAPGAGATYTIRPYADVVYFAAYPGTLVVLDSNSANVHVGDTVEMPIAQDVDAGGFQGEQQIFTPGATMREAFSWYNGGIMALAGIYLQDPFTGTRDARQPWGWQWALNAQNTQIGVQFNTVQDAFEAFNVLGPGLYLGAGAGSTAWGLDLLSFGNGIRVQHVNGGHDLQLEDVLGGALVADGSGTVSADTGAACSGSPTSSFATDANGIVKHC